MWNITDDKSLSSSSSLNHHLYHLYNHLYHHYHVDHHNLDHHHLDCHHHLDHHHLDHHPTIIKIILSYQNHFIIISSSSSRINYYLVCRTSSAPTDPVWLIHVVSTAPVAPFSIKYTIYYITLYYMYDVYVIYSNTLLLL